MNLADCRLSLAELRSSTGVRQRDSRRRAIAWQVAERAVAALRIIAGLTALALAAVAVNPGRHGLAGHGLAGQGALGLGSTTMLVASIIAMHVALLAGLYPFRRGKRRCAELEGLWNQLGREIDLVQREVDRLPRAGGAPQHVVASIEAFCRGEALLGAWEPRPARRPLVTAAARESHASQAAINFPPAIL